MANPDDLNKLQSLIKDIKFAMMTTATSDGTLRSRPMATQTEPFDGTLWFFTDDHSAKVHEILQDTHVTSAMPTQPRTTTSRSPAAARS